jgi:hypothetical protein
MCIRAIHTGTHNSVCALDDERDLQDLVAEGFKV